MIASASDNPNAYREYQANWRRNQSANAQEIAPLPPIKDPARREACKHSLRLFCESYFPQTFYLGWSANHLRAIEKLEDAVKFGNLFALAMPRASGKTAIGKVASLWSVLGGWRKFVVYITANASKAGGMIDSLKSFVRFNALLHDDFGPELYGFVKLEGETRRTQGQKCDGVPTEIGWEQNRIIFPTIPGGCCNGATIDAYGIESGDILGTSRTLSDGQTTIRPDFVIPDDPQTAESAKSKLQNETRHQTLSADVLGMAGPDVRISAVMLCTVKQKDDLAERMLDRKQSPEWRGELMKLMDALPSNLDLWDKYAEIKHECERTDQPVTAATDFYRDNREAMDEGARPTWPDRFDPSQLSAVQYAMDLYYRDRRAFMSEYQNDPLERQASASIQLSPNEIVERGNGLDRQAIPPEAAVLTTFIDVQLHSLWWVQCWFEPNFSGGTFAYGIFPEQGRTYCTNNEIEHGGKTLGAKYPNAGFDGQLFSGLTDLTELLLGREWTRGDGAAMRIDRCLIDANWGRSTRIVKRFCRESKYSTILTPSHGRYVGATSVPFDQYPDRPGERVGENWRMPKPSQTGDVRHLAWDVNYWKSFFHARMSTQIGDPGNFTLYGRTPSAHRMFADHCAAEYSVRVTAKGRAVDEWQERPDRPDNHWFDGVVGCHVAAAMCGVSLPNVGNVSKKVKTRRTLEEMASEARR